MSGYTANREKPSSLHASFLSCASQICTSTGKTESNHVSDEQEMLPPLCAIALLTGFRSAKMCKKKARVYTHTPQLGTFSNTQRVSAAPSGHWALR